MPLHLKRTSPSTLFEEVRRLAEAAQDARAERLEAAGVTALERRLLELLESARGPVAPLDLARPLLCRVSEVEDRLQALQDRGWVVESAATGRVPARFELGLAGQRAVVRLRRVERQLEAALECVLADEDVRATSSLLRAVRRRLQGDRQLRRRPRDRGATLAGDFERPRRTSGAGGACVGVTAATKA